MSKPLSLSCFKAYDIRGRIPDELNEDVAYRIGRAYARFLGPTNVVVGQDMRLSSPVLADALARGLAEGGADVLHIGLCGTEEVYFATSHLKAGGGIMVTASHNPADWNGMKLVREGSRPISGDTGLHEIRRMAETGDFGPPVRQGGIGTADPFPAYLDHLLGYVDGRPLRPLKIVVNAGNGCAGHVIDGLEDRLPFRFIKLQHEPDGTFPHGVPNPLLPENRAGRVHRGLLHRGPAGPGDARAGSRGQNHPRPAAHLEHHRRGPGTRRDSRPEQDGTRLHQGAHAGGGCGLRWRNERPPLLPGFCLL